MFKINNKKIIYVEKLFKTKWSQKNNKFSSLYKNIVLKSKILIKNDHFK